jgi:hypothetical protein
MNFFQIISEIEKVDPEVYDRLDSRRSIFKHMSGLGQKLSAAALPLAVGAIFNKVYAQTPVGAGVNDVLNFALKLEYLESFFYQARTAVVGGFNANVTASLNLITTDEANHVTFLRSVLGTNAIPAPTVATFDYTAKGAFNPTVAAQYLALAQSFEDTGVRAYKGAAPLIMSNKTVLTAALNIHSVEARHASQLRAIRRAMATTGTPAPSQGIAVAPYSAAPKSWISGTDGGGAVPGATDKIYGAGNNTNAPAGITFESEANITQGGVALSGTTITAGSAFPASAFSEAFDEGLDVGTVASIANMFSVSGDYFSK